MKAERNYDLLYPERHAGDFTHVDSTVAFYFRINALLRKDMVVLDLGAGRGEQFERYSAFIADLMRLQGKVRQVIGADIDDAVFENRFLDEAATFEPGQALPFPDASFDLIYADWVLEHVVDVESFAREIDRVLKPGGWFCARTPNLWGVTGIAARFVPNSIHVRVLDVLKAGRKEIDVFPTVYRLNTLGALRRVFDPVRWQHCSYLSNNEPPYVQNHLALMWTMLLLWRLVPRRFYTVLYVFLRKKLS